MIVYTKGNVTSFDMKTPISTKVRPCFNFALTAKNAGNLGIRDGMSVLEISDAVSLLSPVGKVIIENTDAADVVDATGRVSQGGALIVTREYCMLVYTAGNSFTIYKTDAQMIPHFGKMLPTEVISTEAARAVGATPNAYTFVDGGILETFEQSECARIPHCSYALSQNGRLVAVFGLRTGSATLDFKPNGLRGARASLLSKTRRQVSGVQYDDTVGAYVADASSVRSSIEELRSSGVLSTGFCYSFNRPDSLATSLATRLAFLLINTEENRAGATNAVFLATDGMSDGDHVREFVNEGPVAAQYISSLNTSYAWIQSENDALYQKLIDEGLENLTAAANSVIQTIREHLTAYRKVQNDTVPVNGVIEGLYGLVNLPLDRYSTPQSLAKFHSVEEWKSAVLAELGSWAEFIEAGIADDGKGNKVGYFKLASKVVDEKEEIALDTFLNGDRSYRKAVSDRISDQAIQMLKPILPADLVESAKVRQAYERGEPFSWLSGSGLGELDAVTDIFDGDSNGFLSPSRIVKNWHECHKCDAHCERSLISLGPGLRIGEHPRSCNDSTKEIPVSAKGDVFGFLAALPYHTWSYTMTGKLKTTVRAGYGAQDMVHVRSLQLRRATRKSSGVIECVVDAKIAVRYFDMFGAWEPEYTYHQLNKDIVRHLLARHGIETGNVSLAGIVKFNDYRRNAPTWVTYENYGCLPNFKVPRPIAPDSYDGITPLHAGEPYTLCDYTLLNVCLTFLVDEPEFMMGDNGDLSAAVGQMGSNLLESAANTAAEDLVASLDSVGALDKVKLLYDLDGYGLNFMQPEDAQQVSAVTTSPTTAATLAAQLLLLRDSRNRNSGHLIMDPSDPLGKCRRDQITSNVKAIMSAALMDYVDFDIEKVRPGPDKDGNVPEGYISFDIQSLTAYLLTKFAPHTSERKVHFWFRGDLSQITPREKDLRLWPYYGALV